MNFNMELELKLIILNNLERYIMEELTDALLQT